MRLHRAQLMFAVALAACLLPLASAQGGWSAPRAVDSTPTEPDTVTVTATTTATPTSISNGSGWGGWSGRNESDWRERRERWGRTTEAAAATPAVGASAADAPSAGTIAAIAGAAVGGLLFIGLAVIAGILLARRNHAAAGVSASSRERRNTMDMLAEKLQDSASRDRVLEALNRIEFNGPISVKDGGSEAGGASSVAASSQPTYIVLSVPPPARVPANTPPVPPLSPLSEAFSDAGDYDGYQQTGSYRDAGSAIAAAMGSYRGPDGYLATSFGRPSHMR